jgi:hypothetical protein
LRFERLEGRGGKVGDGRIGHGTFLQEADFS